MGGGGGSHPEQLEWGGRRALRMSMVVARWPARRSSMTAGAAAGAGPGHGMEDSGQAEAWRGGAGAPTWSRRGVSRSQRGRRRSAWGSGGLDGRLRRRTSSGIRRQAESGGGQQWLCVGGDVGAVCEYLGRGTNARSRGG
jgi:hypothetical protein